MKRFIESTPVILVVRCVCVCVHAHTRLDVKESENFETSKTLDYNISTRLRLYTIRFCVSTIVSDNFTLVCWNDVEKKKMFLSRRKALPVTNKSLVTSVAVRWISGPRDGARGRPPKGHTLDRRKSGVVGKMTGNTEEKKKTVPGRYANIVTFFCVPRTTTTTTTTLPRHTRHSVLLAVNIKK